MVGPGQDPQFPGETRREHVEAPRRAKKTPLGRGLLGAILGVFVGAAVVYMLYPAPAPAESARPFVPYLLAMVGGAIGGGILFGLLGAMFSREGRSG